MMVRKPTHKKWWLDFQGRCIHFHTLPISSPQNGWPGWPFAFATFTVDNRGQAAPTLSYRNPVCQAVGQPKCLLYVLMLASLDVIDWWKRPLRMINPDTKVLTDKHFEIHLHVEWLMWCTSSESNKNAPLVHDMFYQCGLRCCRETVRDFKIFKYDIGTN